MLFVSSLIISEIREGRLPSPVAPVLNINIASAATGVKQKIFYCNSPSTVLVLDARHVLSYIYICIRNN